jgi:hypothetical protein
MLTLIRAGRDPGRQSPSCDPIIVVLRLHVSHGLSGGVHQVVLGSRYELLASPALDASAFSTEVVGLGTALTVLVAETIKRV